MFTQATNLELGIAAGLLLSALFFSFQYARLAKYAVGWSQRLLRLCDMHGRLYAPISAAAGCM